MVATSGAVGATASTAAAASGAFERIELQVDNDTFASPRRDERWYTSGVRVRGYRHAGADPPAPFVAGWCRALAGCDAGARVRTVLSVGQQLYTPAAPGRDAPRPDDRPYAGWLFGSAAQLFESGDRWHSVGLRVGVVGPAAFGESSQDAAHRLLGQQPARRWRWQLRPTLGVQADFAGLRSHRLGERLDLVRKPEATAGNLAVNVAAGAVLRWGELPDSPTYPGQPDVSSAGAARWYAYGGAEARLVGRDRLVDGPAFGYDSRVRSRPLVADLLAGVSLAVAPALRLDLAVTQRQPEFDTPAAVRLRPQRFGTILLRWTPGG